MNREELQTILPHRAPMLLVDESEIVEENIVESSYTIPEDPWFTRGHFPGYPVVPGVILCEIMAQSSVLLIPKEQLVPNLAMYGGLDDVKFKNSVFPGDKVCVRSHTTVMRPPLVVVESEAKVNGKLCCKGTLKFMLVPKDKLGL